GSHSSGSPCWREGEMLKPEAAQAELEKIRVKDWEDQLVGQLTRLPCELAEPGLVLLERDAQGKEFKDWEGRQQAEQRAAQQLDELTEHDRLRLLEPLFPKLARHAAAGWELAKTLPYQVEHTRKGFRAPRNAEVTRDARFNWLKYALQIVGGYD